MMLIQSEPWPLDTERCPADLDYVSYLEANEIEGASLFHMGSGGHHLLGQEGARHNNSVLAVTNCREEMSTYIDWAERHPRESQFYKCLFADIHQMDVRQLPRFDYVSLFHLGELGDTPDYAAHGIAGVVSLLSGRMTWNGRFVFYRRSAAWDKVEPIIDQMLHAEWEADGFASLVVLRRTS